MDRYTLRLATLLAFGGLLVVLDTTVSVVAMPRLIEYFDASLTTVQWVTSGYTLALVAVIPTASWAIERWGAKRVYLVALAVFVIGSAAAALAWNLESLIAFRVLQGLGGGLLNPVGMTLALRAAGRDKRGAVMSILGLPVLVGPVFGLTLGGWLIDTFSWRWIFGIVVPIGIVALTIGTRVIRPDTTGTRVPLDVAGLSMLTPGAVLLVFGLARMEESGPVSVPVLGPVFAGLGLLGWFAARSVQRPGALLRIELLSRRSLAVGSITLIAAAAAYFGSSMVLPTYIQVARADTATVAGLIVIPVSLGGGLSLQVATRLVDRVAPQRIIMTGTLLAAAGVAGTLAALTADTPYAVLALTGFVTGVGIGATLLPTITAATMDLGNDELPSGMAIVTIFTQIAVALGTAVVATTMAAAIDDGLPQLGGTGVAGAMAIDGDRRTAIAGPLADAMQFTLFVPLTLLLFAAIAAYWLPRPRAERLSASPVRVR